MSKTKQKQKPTSDFLINKFEEFTKSAGEAFLFYLSLHYHNDFSYSIIIKVE